MRGVIRSDRRGDCESYVFGAEGIYLTPRRAGGPSSWSWRQDPAGGPARLINDTIAAPIVGGGAA